MNELVKNYSKLSVEKQKAVRALLKQKGVDIDDLIILPRNTDEKILPVSFAQQRLWFLEQFEPGSPLYVIPMGVKVKGNLNPDALETSVNKIIERHEVLRTTFLSDNGEVKQKIHEKLNIKSNYIEIQSNDEQELKNIIIEESTKPFDLVNGPLLRLTIIKTGDDEFIVLLPMHHIVSDNWSTGIFVKELIDNYQNFVSGKVKSQPDLTIQYADFAIWQKNRLESGAFDKQIDYWLNQLKNCNTVLDIITDKPRPQTQTFNGSFELFEIDENLYASLVNLAKKNDVTLFMVLIAAFYVLLYRYTNQEDINIGTPIANRNRAEIENLIGFFINTLVLRSQIDGNETVKNYLQQIKKIALEAYENQDIPFETIVEKLNIERDISRTALFQAMFVLNNAPVAKLELENVIFEPLEIDTGTTKFDLVMSITETDNKLKGKFEYNTDLFESFTIKQLIRVYKNILRSFTEDSDATIDSIPLLREDEVLEHGSITLNESLEIEQSSIPALFREAAGENIDKTAITCGNESITFGKLEESSDALARLLLKQNIKKGETVGVYLNRSIDYIAAFIGILKAGGVYLPLDVEYPDERLDYILKDSETKVVLTSDDYSGKLPEHITKINVNSIDGTQVTSNGTQFPAIKPEDAAYMIYTSGSTGKPKGTVINHGSFVKHYFSVKENFGTTKNDVVLQFAAFVFDASIEQILVPLLTGAQVILRDDKLWTPKEFTEQIKQHKITVVNPPTVVWEELTKFWYEHPDSAPDDLVRLFIAGGDEMKSDFVSKWNDSKMKNVRLLNAYGPTETVITASTYLVKQSDSNKYRIPIGKPLLGRSFYVLDKNGNILPKGFPGELCISGIIADGYYRRRELTEEKFVYKNLADGTNVRYYKTGDMARIREEGDYEFLGRIDSQVKIRGFRIELGEIEQTLREIDSIKDALVIAAGDSNNKFLAAYILSDENIDEAEIIDYLSTKLPAYMVPAVIMQLDEFPKLPSGKIDKNSLPEIENIRRKIKTEFVMPRTPMEEAITKIVTEILGVEKVGVFDNFFELGGHSMLAMHVISKINEEFNVEISIKSLFENPTVDGIAKAVLEAQLLDEEDDELEALLNEITGISPEELGQDSDKTNN